MSKYIKLENAIHAIAENMAHEANLKKHCNEPTFCAGEFLVEAEMSVKDLPTIEVSNDCISKEWLVKALKEVSSESEYPRGFNEAIRFIKSAPSVVPKRGEWVYDAEAYPIGNPYGCYKCDQCGDIVPDKTNFCPNCGADMRGDEE